VLPVAPDIIDHDGVVRLVFDSQRYVMVPEPEPFVTLVNAAGFPPLQIVWSEPMLPALTGLCTVTVTAAVATDSHATEFNVETVILRYWVVVVNPAGTS
jgi:hypothetical protein